jgi:hypothetical protein
MARRSALKDALTIKDINPHNIKKASEESGIRVRSMYMCPIGECRWSGYYNEIEIKQHRKQHDKGEL